MCFNRWNMIESMIQVKLLEPLKLFMHLLYRSTKRTNDFLSFLFELQHILQNMKNQLILPQTTKRGYFSEAIFNYYSANYLFH